MTVRNKVYAVLAITAVVFLAAVHLLTGLIMGSHVKAGDEARAAENLDRVLFALDNELNAFDRFAHDFSAWDDTADFVVKPSPGFIKSSLPVSAFTVNRLSFLVFLDRQGRVVWEKGFDLAASRFEPVPAGLAAHCPACQMTCPSSARLLAPSAGRRSTACTPGGMDRQTATPSGSRSQARSGTRVTTTLPSAAR